MATKTIRKKQPVKLRQSKKAASTQSQYITVMTFVFFLLSLLFLAMVFAKYY